MSGAAPRTPQQASTNAHQSDVGSTDTHALEHVRGGKAGRCTEVHRGGNAAVLCSRCAPHTGSTARRVVGAEHGCALAPIGWARHTEVGDCAAVVHWSSALRDVALLLTALQCTCTKGTHMTTVVKEGRTGHRRNEQHHWNQINTRETRDAHSRLGTTSKKQQSMECNAMTKCGGTAAEAHKHAGHMGYRFE
jgi:hypothetical protein